ncbi:hypothetical protein [Glutamicibacter sp. AOP5-A2-18]|uniref:hypothetical protein n=1 Tax=Glutamicibacter sp. AOP5-A2-18 TaxID=3457656 RepID=UPI004033FE1A
MGLFAEIFRVQDWRRTPLLIWLPFTAWVVAAVSTNLVLILVGWPGSPWRLLIALMIGVVASGVARWLVVRRQQERATLSE